MSPADIAWFLLLAYVAGLWCAAAVLDLHKEHRRE